jgi:hypothetical protein
MPGIQGISATIVNSLVAAVEKSKLCNDLLKQFLHNQGLTPSGRLSIEAA